MKKMRQIFLLGICALGFLITQEAKAQDVHYTLYNQVPLVFNPAQTGGFLGSYRIAGIYRDQYRSVFSNAYKTPSFSVDVPIVKGFREQDWIGVGLMFYADRSGTVGQTWQAFKLSGAYHFTLGSRGQSSFSIGYQTGSVGKRYRRLTQNSFNDPREYAAFLQENPEGPEDSFTDHVGGLRFSTQYNKTDRFYIGVAASRFGRPDFSVIQGEPMDSSVIGTPQLPSNYRLDPKIVFQAGLSFLSNEKLRIAPSLQIQKIFGVPEYEAEVQVEGMYLLNAEKKTALILGTGIRYGGPLDAASVLVGLQKDALKVMVAYDFNVSALTKASGGFGGFELSAVYIGKVYKRPNPDPVIFCPRL
jgi:type IX secretion system PorP/SprF family membrane protein